MVLQHTFNISVTNEKQLYTIKQYIEFLTGSIYYEILGYAKLHIIPPLKLP